LANIANVYRGFGDLNRREGRDRKFGVPELASCKPTSQNRDVGHPAAAGVWIDPKRQDEGYGKFAWIQDCDGNRVELWQPIAD